MRHMMAQDVLAGLEVWRTEDLAGIKELARRTGLEVEEGPLRGIIVAYGLYDGDRLVGSATLEQKDIHTFLEWVAVDESLRGRGAGRALVAAVEDDAKDRGMKELWAKARMPGFYERIGFRVLGDDEIGPKTLDGCKDCPQFRTSCFPAIVVKAL